MIVKAIWEFDVDVSDLDPKFVDIPGLSKDLARCELQYMLRNHLITADEFEKLILRGPQPEQMY